MARLDPAEELSDLRNVWRSAARTVHPGEYGTRGVELFTSSKHLLNEEERYPVRVPIRCEGCQVLEYRGDIDKTCILGVSAFHDTDSIQDFFDKNHEYIQSCRCCGKSMKIVHGYKELLCIDIRDRPDVLVNTHIDVRQTLYRLAGVIYFGNFHFTARVITKDGRVYSHDGMDGAYSSYQGQLDGHGSRGLDLKVLGGKPALILVYCEDLVSNAEHTR
jgi:hypothetical protein